MPILNQINEAAILWNKTKDPKYKAEWYRLINLFAHGTTSDPFARRNVQFDSNRNHSVK